ncbi:MAG: zinc dependent phospholipase C family protein [Bacillota bacterium]
MPDFWTHLIAGEEMIKKSKNRELTALFRDHPEIFNFGCQGPDFFFYSDFWPWIKEKEGIELGEKLHQEKTVTLIVEILKYLKEIKKLDKNIEKYQKSLLYLSGFIAHYALDLKVHPFIYEYGGSGISHKKLEMELDLKVADKMWSLNVEKLSPVNFFNFGNKLPEYITDFYIHIFKKVFFYNRSAKQINESYQDFKKFHRIFYSPQGMKAAIIRFVDKLIPIEITLYSYKANADFEILNDHLYSLFKKRYDEGIKEGLRLYENIFDFLNDNISEVELENIIEKKNFSGKKLIN